MGYKPSPGKHFDDKRMSDFPRFADVCTIHLRLFSAAGRVPHPSPTSQFTIRFGGQEDQYVYVWLKGGRTYVGILIISCLSQTRYLWVGGSVRLATPNETETITDRVVHACQVNRCEIRSEGTSRDAVSCG